MSQGIAAKYGKIKYIPASTAEDLVCNAGRIHKGRKCKRTLVLLLWQPCATN